VDGRRCQSPTVYRLYRLPSVTSYTPARVQGTFTGTATRYQFNPNPVALGTMHVNGKFNAAFDNVVAIKLRCYLFAC
jgi:hypothetical protein